jgi:hypothetical protein
MGPVNGPVLGAFRGRSEALTAEMRLLKATSDSTKSDCPKKIG